MEEKKPIVFYACRNDEISKKIDKLVSDKEFELSLDRRIESWNRFNDLIVLCDYLSKFKWLLPKRIKRIIGKYVD